MLFARSLVFDPQAALDMGASAGGGVSKKPRAPTLYGTWVGMGGEGIVLKDPASLYRPGEGSPGVAQAQADPRREGGGQQPFELQLGARASVVCWGVMPSGMSTAPIVSELGALAPVSI